MSDEHVFDYSTGTTEQVNVNVAINSTPALDDTLSITGSIQLQKRHPPLQLMIPDQGSDEYKQFKDIMEKMKFLGYNTIHKLPWHIRREIEDLLNKEKDNKCDWRGVASRLGLKTTFIDKMERSPPENPCNEIFDQKSNEKADLLVQILYKMERRDVLDYIHTSIDELIPKKHQSEKQAQWQSSKYPSQETTPESVTSTSDNSPGYHLSSPPNKGGTPKSEGTPKSPGSNKQLQVDEKSGRKRSGSIPKQHIDATDYSNGEDHKTKLDFHSSYSKHFWESILPNPYSTRKEWKHFEKTLKEKFPKVSHESQLLRFICYILKVQYEERHNQYVSDQDFANMVAWFGPLKEDIDHTGCLQRISKLIKESVAYNNTNTGGHSFFAGYMTKDDADKAVKDSEVGTFLIRFSATFAQDGKFVLVLNTEHGPENHIIEQHENPCNGTLIFDGKTYSDIIHLYKERLRKGGVSQDRRTSCIKTCQNLPLNSMFRSYSSGPSPSFGRGRGRGKNV